jgi:divalent metal cation (Fe/Co/Zn/Cd) transporter
MTAANRIGAVLLGLVLLALGVLTVIETFAVTFWNSSWPFPVRHWRGVLNSTPWSNGWVLTTAIIVFGVGLLLLILELWRVHPARVDTAWNTGDQTWELSRGSVERQATAAAQTVSGVEDASASASGSAHHWRLAVTATAAHDAVDAGQIQDAVKAQLRYAGAPEDVPVRVRVRRARSRA